MGLHLPKKVFPFGAFQLVRINPSGGEGQKKPALEGQESFQLVRINPSGGELVLATSGGWPFAFQLVRINPSGGVYRPDC